MKKAFSIFFIAAIFLILFVLQSFSNSKQGYTSLAIDSSTGRIFAVHDDKDGVDVLDLTTGAISAAILVDKQIKAIDVDQDKKILAAAEDNQLHILTTDSFEILSTIPLSDGAISVSIDPASGIALVTHDGGTVSIVDLNSYRLVTETATLEKPVSSVIDSGLQIGVIVHQTWGVGSEKEKTRDNVTLIDLVSFSVIKTLSAGKNPRHVAINPVTHQAAVANEKGDDVTIIDLNTKTISTTIAQQKQPLASSFNSCLNTLTVIGGEENAWLQVFDLATMTTKTTYSFDRKINDVKVEPSVNEALIASKDGLLMQRLPNPVPELVSLSPEKAYRGETSFSVKLTGKGLLSTTEIYLNGNKTETTYSACESLTVNVPTEYLQNTGKVEVKAVNSAPEGGTSNLLYLNIDNPVPGITALQPTQVTAGDAGLTLNVTGSGFFEDTTVSVNGIGKTFTWRGNNLLSIDLTASDLEVGSYLDITASNPQPGGGISACARFTVLNAIPTLSSIEPTSINAGSPDSSIVLTGDNFVKTSTVKFNGQTYATRFVNKTQIEATLPAGALINAGAYPVTVVNPTPGGGESQSLTLSVLQVGNPNVEPLPDGSFGKQYEDLIPADATLKAYTSTRFAVITGLVKDKNQNPIADVVVSILGLSEYGTAKTDSNGKFNLPVDGGGTITVVFKKTGLITSHRQVDVPWNDIINTETVAMIPEDSRSSTITFDGNPSTVMVHTSTKISDSFGSRSLTMVFTGDNRVTATDANGNQTQLTSFTTRATEFDTPESMPAKLPPTSAYTYCSELSVDGATNAKFDKPVTFYVDNFLGFSVGEVVPVGYYDREKGLWIASDNGVVVRLLDMDGDGIVDALDSTGDGLPDDVNNNGSNSDDAAGLTDSNKFPPNSTYWRVQLDHFSPWDCNWSYGPPPDAIPPNPERPPVIDGQQDNDDTDCNGSYCERRNRTAHEDVQISGTDMTLHYASNRTPGYKRVITIPASGSTVPASLANIFVRMEVAGLIFETTLPALPNQTAEFIWDGLDYRGRPVTGARPANISIGFSYQVVYYLVPRTYAQAWAMVGKSITSIPGRQEFITWKHSTLKLESGVTDAMASGWTLSSHHNLDPWEPNILFKGDGTTSKNIAGIITTVLSNSIPYGVAVDAAGNVYIAEYSYYYNVIRKIDSKGAVTVVAGTSGRSGSFSGDGGPATKASLYFPTGVAIDSAGNIFIADTYNHRIRRVDTNGIITTIAGIGGVGPYGGGYSGDGGPAIEAKLNNPEGVAVDSAGNVYIADVGNNRIRQVNSSGIITTVAGNGQAGFSGDKGAATNASLYYPNGVTVDSAGNIYISDSFNYRIRKVDTSGVITTAAGNGQRSYSGNNGPATKASLSFPTDVAVDSAGNFYIADLTDSRIRKVDTSGIITTLAGDGTNGFAGDGGTATKALLYDPIGVAVNRGGDIFVADRGNKRIRKILPSGLIAQVDAAGGIFFSEGTGLGYSMSSSGFHMSTVDIASNKTLVSFGYNTNDKITSVTDRFGNQTTVQRDGQGKAVSITSPDGIVTALTIDNNNHLTQVGYPDGSYYSFGYSPDGLLTDQYDRNGNLSMHGYDSYGRITDVFDSEGGEWNYSRSVAAVGDVFSTFSTGESNSTTYQDSTDLAGSYTSVKTEPTGEITTVTRSSDELTETITSSCDMKVSNSYDIDSVYKFKYLSKSITNSPSSLSKTSNFSKTYQDTNGDGKKDRITATASVNGKTSTTTNDTRSGTITNVSPTGRTVTINYDPATLLTRQITIPALNSVQYNYDERGRSVSMATGSRTVSLTYDDKGNVASRTDALGNVVSYTYDKMNRLTEMRSPNSELTTFMYDLNGNMTVLTNPMSISNVFDYTGTNLRKTWNTPTSGGYQYAYDKEKKLKSITFPAGKTISNAYTNGLLTVITTPEDTVGYTYDCGDKLSAAAKGNEKVSFTYDGTLLTGDTRSGTISHALSYTYNNDLRLTKLSYSGTSHSFGYDDDGLLTTAGGYTITRNSQNGLPENVTDGTISVARMYSSYGEMNQNTYSVKGSPVYDWTLTRDNTGRITQKVENLKGTAITSTYDYDKNGRLTQVKQNGTIVESYTYDGDGNRTLETNTLRNISNKTYTYSVEDHILTAGADSYQFDQDGFLTSKLTSAGTTTVVYSTRGELLTVNLPDGRTINYDHDPFGRRIAKSVDGAITEKYLWQTATRLLAVYDDSNNVLMQFTYADNRTPVSMVKEGVTYYLLYDQIGSLKTIIDSSGNLIKELAYDSFGSILYDTDTSFTVPLGFAGGLHDVAFSFMPALRSFVTSE
jgi:YD repeat-containing protein